MSIISSQIQTYLHFEETFRREIESYESDLIDRLHIQEASEKKSILTKNFIAELRPLCETLPPDGLDPVSYEPFVTPVVYRCGHVLDQTTVLTWIQHAEDDPCWDKLLKCPICSVSTGRSFVVPCIPLEGIIEHLQKISTIFQKYHAQ